MVCGAEYEAVVGATFAYFTASTQTSGSATSTVETTELKGATIKFTSEASKFELLNYPGGLAVYGAKATIEKQQPDDENDYEATFNLKIDYTNQTNTDLDWELYMVESAYDGLDTAQTTTCTLRQKGDGAETQFWYSDASDAGTDNTASCKAETLVGKLTGTMGGTKIAHGKLNASTPSGTITKNDLDSETNFQDSGDLEGRKINTSTTKSKYYYIVVKYPNSGEDQSPTDAGKTISATLSIDGEVASTIYSAGE